MLVKIGSLWVDPEAVDAVEVASLAKGEEMRASDLRPRIIVHLASGSKVIRVRDDIALARMEAAHFAEAVNSELEDDDFLFSDDEDESFR